MRMTIIPLSIMTFLTLGSKDEFNAYVEKAKSLTPYTIDETATYGDKLVTLSTCAYHANEGRYVCGCEESEKKY